MHNFLFFSLYGAMASWGDITVGQMRPSSLYPSKSALVGIMAAAFGYTREQAEEITALGNAIRFAVKMETPPLMIQDYHTVQRAKGIAPQPYYTRRDEILSAKGLETTPLSKRDYLCDALATIALWQHDDKTDVLEAFAAAVASPAFHLYLGRKSCPISLPITPEWVAADTLKEAFEKYTPANSYIQEKRKVLLKKAKNTTSHSTRLYWEECAFAGLEPTAKLTRRDDPRSRTRWQFGERIEYVALGDEQHTKEEVQL